MCGIVAILRRRSERSAPSAATLLDLVTRAEASFDAYRTDALTATTARLVELNRLLLGVPGCIALLDSPGLSSELRSRLDPMVAALAKAAGEIAKTAAVDENLNAARRSTSDVLWAILRDRLRVPEGVRLLGGSGRSHGVISALCSLHDALSALDRLEVRGRDSIGLHVFISGHGLDLDEPSLARAIADRSEDSFLNNSVRRVGNTVSVVYKQAAEIGELGDNTAALRGAIAADDLLRKLLEPEHAQVTVIGHTRWASVGIISEANAHPVNSEAVGAERDPYFIAALNGDVDNYADLAAAAGLEFRRVDHHRCEGDPGARGRPHPSR